MPRDLVDLAVSALAAARSLPDAEEAAVRAVALNTTRIIRGEIRSATGGDMRLSGVGRRGARVGARFDVRPGADAQAIIRATGPLHLIERDTAPHEIPRPRRRGRKRYAVIDGQPYSRAQHPGTSGKHPWAKGARKGQAEAMDLFRATVNRHVLRAWGLS